MKLVHFSDSTINHLRTIVQPKPGEAYVRADLPLGKPVGFWVSVEGNGDGWSDWCERQKFIDTKKQNVYRVRLKKNANILRLESAEDIHNFSEKYKAKDSFMNDLGTRVYEIDWRIVAEQYQGIIITPYVWSCRLSVMWYYGWDCASGCIWDPSAISSLKLDVLEGSLQL